MKRVVVSIICMVLILLMLAACASPDNQITNTSGASSSETSAPYRESGQKTILVTASTSLSEVYSGEQAKRARILRGSSPSVVLSLPKILRLQADLVIENLTLVGDATTIYANGYKLVIDASVTTPEGTRLTVYGGSDHADLKKNTNLILLGGCYGAVYGGSKGYQITGDTHVFFGGNANMGDTIDDSSSKLSPCIVYGGGNNGAVAGETHVTLSGNAVAKLVSGVGVGKKGGRVKVANINISGGKVMNVFGGSLNAQVKDLTVNITVTGGLCEAIFGGCQNKNMSGTVNIKLLGGEISRRVYTGCYNVCNVGVFKHSWVTDCSVTGTTTLAIGPNVKLCTKNGLSSENSVDIGVFCGSRYDKKAEGEYNILIFLDGCYEQMIQKIGPAKNSWIVLCQSRHDEVVKQ